MIGEMETLWSCAVDSLGGSCDVPLSFAGVVSQGRMKLEHFSGNRTRLLDGLTVQNGAGAGGRAWAEGRVMGIGDYRRSRAITHDYDRPVLTEGISALVAAPVVVGTSVRGVLYSAVRDGTYGDRLAGATQAAATRLARDISRSEEVTRQVAAQTLEVRQREAETLERLRRVHAELSAVSAGDPVLKERLSAVMAAIVSAEVGAPHLTVREVDVLALAAGGHSYAEIARRLGLSAQTVKGYMRDVIVHLGVHGRHEAVVCARRFGLLP